MKPVISNFFSAVPTVISDDIYILLFQILEKAKVFST